MVDDGNVFGSNPRKWPFVFTAFAAGTAGGVVAGAPAWVALTMAALLAPFIGLGYWFAVRWGRRVGKGI